MKFIKQFSIILLITFLGELMVIALRSGLVKVEHVKETAVFLIEIMPVMFIPAGAGLLESWGVLQPIWLPVCIITVATTVIVMAVTGRVTQAIIRAEKKKKEGKQA